MFDFREIWKGPMREKESVTVELSKREVELLLRYGCPFQEQ